VANLDKRDFDKDQRRKFIKERVINLGCLACFVFTYFSKAMGDKVYEGTKYIGVGTLKSCGLGRGEVRYIFSLYRK